MLVVTRFTVPAREADPFADRVGTVLAALAACPGYLRGSLARAVDDPARWVLLTEWSGAGAYRRALSRYEVRVCAIPLLALAHDEPGAFEVVRQAAPGGPVTAHAGDLATEAAGDLAGDRTADPAGDGAA